MLCQSYKRLKWQSKLSARLLNVPYVHITFTLPKELRGLARRNEKQIYSILFKSAWHSVDKIGKEIGAELGMISVLHTWGSDLKYHPHVHCLVTFGGLNTKSNWIWPKSNRRLGRYKKINRYYKESFMTSLKLAFSKGLLSTHSNYEDLELEVGTKNWVVNNDWPSQNTEIIETYLAKYINRSAVSKKRILYNSQTGEVFLMHKDYKNQEQGKAAPYKQKKMSALSAIHQIVKHKLPPHFHRVRYYGIHHPVKEKKIKQNLSSYLLRNRDSVQILFALLTKMLNQLNKPKKRVCEECGSTSFDKEKIAGDLDWIYKNVVGYGLNKSPPKNTSIY